MKNTKKSLVFLLLIICSMFVSNGVFADPPGPPTDHGAGGNQNPGPVGAPIDGGLGILVILAGSAGYSGLKLYKAWKKEKETVELES